VQIELTSVVVEDQATALRFYTGVAVFDHGCGTLIQLFQR
jgi:hypothetical protein